MAGKKKKKGSNTTLYLILGAIGLVFVYLWFGAFKAHEVTDHVTEILGNEKLAMGITAAQKRFIVDEYNTGAKVEDLQAIAGQFYSKSGFSVEDARVHLFKGSYKCRIPV